MMFQYAAAGLAATTLLGIGGFWAQTERLAAVNSALEFRNAELAACAGRLQSVLDDVRSDNEVDLLPDDALRDVPDHWLLPDPAGSPSP